MRSEGKMRSGGVEAVFLGKGFPGFEAGGLVVKIVAQGRLLTVTPGAHSLGSAPPPRRRIVAYSGKSRKRLLDLFARLRSPDSRGYRYKVSFLTLTSLEIFSPRAFKKHLFTFLKRVRRRYGGLAAVWRLEFQERGAPHAHLVMYNAPWIDKGWIQSSWGEVIGQERPFTRIERVRSHRALLAYVSKYVAKDGGFIYKPKLTDEGEIGEGGALGRVWGVFQRVRLPFDEVAVAVVPLDGSWWLMRRYCQKLWGDLDGDSPYGFTVFCDDPYGALAVLYKMSCDFRFS